MASLLEPIWLSLFETMGMRVLSHRAFTEPQEENTFELFTPRGEKRELYATLHCTVSLPVEHKPKYFELVRDEEGNPLVEIYMIPIEKHEVAILIEPRVNPAKRLIDCYYFGLYTPSRRLKGEIYEIRTGGFPLELYASRMERETFQRFMNLVSMPNLLTKEDWGLFHSEVILDLLPIYREFIKRWEESATSFIPVVYRYFLGLADKYGKSKTRKYSSLGRIELLSSDYLRAIERILKLIDELKSINPKIILKSYDKYPLAIRIWSYPAEEDVLEVYCSDFSNYKDLDFNYTYLGGNLTPILKELSRVVTNIAHFLSLPPSSVKIEELINQYPHLKPFLLLYRDFLTGAIGDIPLENVYNAVIRAMQDIPSSEKPISASIDIKQILAPLFEISSDTYREEKFNIFTSGRAIKLLTTPRVGRKKKRIETEKRLVSASVEAMREIFGMEPRLVVGSGLKPRVEKSRLTYKTGRGIYLLSTPSIFMSLRRAPIKDLGIERYLSVVLAPREEKHRVEKFIKKLEEKLGKGAIDVSRTGEAGSVLMHLVELYPRHVEESEELG